MAFKNLIKWIYGCLFVIFPITSFALTQVVTVNNLWELGNDNWYPYAMSSDWRYVLFSSYADNLVANDTNWEQDVFVRDTVSGITIGISIDIWGLYQWCCHAAHSITQNGRYVLFSSNDDQLVTGDTNWQNDVFVRDILSWTTTRINISSSGNESNGYSQPIAMTPDGRYILFQSYADNLVLNDTNFQSDVFIRDTVNNTTIRVSVDSLWNEGNNFSQPTAITPDGRYVLFLSSADNLVASDTNTSNDTFVRDTINNTTIRVNIDNLWNEGNNEWYPTAITPDGRYVLFNSYADNLVANDTNSANDSFVRDILNNTTTRISIGSTGNEGNSYSEWTAITPDWRFVLFWSDSNNFIPNDTNWNYEAFVRDTVNNITIWASVDSSGNVWDSISSPISITPDGRFVLFQSFAGNLVPNDTNIAYDVFVKDTVSGTTTRVSVDSMWNEVYNTSSALSITPDGKYVLFQSTANNLVPNDVNRSRDAFLNEWQVLLWAAPTIVNPVDWTYRNTNADIVVQWLWNSWADIRVTFLGNQFSTTVGNNNEWIVQLPWQWDAIYTVYAQQKAVWSGMWSATWSSTFTIDTTNPAVPTIVTPIENELISWWSMYVVWVWEVGWTITVKVWNTTKVAWIDGAWNRNAWPFIIAPWYKYGIVAKQSDLAWNQSNWSEIRTVYGVVAWTVSVNPSDYKADLVLTKRWVSGTWNETNTNPSENIRYTLDYLNAWNGYATWVMIYEQIPVNTCYTVWSISGLNSDYIVEYSNTQWASYSYIPIWATWSQDCRVTHFRVINKFPYEAKSNVVTDSFWWLKVSLVGTDTLYLQQLSFEATDLPWSSQNFYRWETWDFNNDWNLDVVGFGYYGHQSIVYINQWTWVFIDTDLPWWWADFRGWEVADFDGDWDADIIGFWNNHNSRLYINQWTWVFVDTDLPWWNTQFVYWDVVDIDSDGDIDIVWYWYIGSSKLYINQWTWVFVNSNLPWWNTMFYDWDVVDFDNDGDIDVVWYGFGWVSRLYLNQWTWVFVNSNLPWWNTELVYWDIADINNDGNIDIIWYWYIWNSKLYINQWAWVFIDSPLPWWWTDFRIGEVADFNGDWDLDIVWYWYGVESKLYINQWTWVFMTGTNIWWINFFGYGNNLDIDNDGDIDLVWFGYGGVSKLFTNQWTWLFLEMAFPWWVWNFISSIIWDVNNDWNVDLIWFDFNWYSKIFTQISSDTTWTYTTILTSTWNITAWNTLLVWEDVVSGVNNIEYTIYGVTDVNECDTSTVFVWPIKSTDEMVDIHNVTWSSICVVADFSILTWKISPLLNSMIATWNNEDIDSFTFAVKVNTGNYMWTTVVNTAYINSSSIEANTVNNSDNHTFIWLPNVSNYGWGYGWWQWGSKWWSKVSPVNPITPIDITKPETPIVVIPSRNTPPISPVMSVEVRPTTPNIAIKEAIVQTSYISVWSTVGVKTVTNTALQSDKKCYTPKEVVDITLWKNATNKDLLVYQALLKSYDLTMFSDTDSYKPENGLKRYEAAKMFTNFAKHVLCRESINTYNNEYTDIENIDETLKPYIIQAYEYGILNWSNHTFRPLDRISRKEFVASLMRMFTNENMDIQWMWNEWDSNYQTLFKAYGLESIVGIDEQVDRYDMSKIMYKLYYNPTYEWTEKGYVLPYGRD